MTPFLTSTGMAPRHTCLQTPIHIKLKEHLNPPTHPPPKREKNYKDVHFFFPGICYYSKENTLERDPCIAFRDFRRDIFVPFLSASSLLRGKVKQN